MAVAPAGSVPVTGSSPPTGAPAARLGTESSGQRPASRRPARHAGRRPGRPRPDPSRCCRSAACRSTGRRPRPTVPEDGVTVFQSSRSPTGCSVVGGGTGVHGRVPQSTCGVSWVSTLPSLLSPCCAEGLDPHGVGDRDRVAGRDRTHHSQIGAGSGRRHRRAGAGRLLDHVGVVEHAAEVVGAVDDTGRGAVVGPGQGVGRPRRRAARCSPSAGTAVLLGTTCGSGVTTGSGLHSSSVQPGTEAVLVSSWSPWFVTVTE